MQSLLIVFLVKGLGQGHILEDELHQDKCKYYSKQPNSHGACYSPEGQAEEHHIAASQAKAKDAPHDDEQQPH